MSITRDIKYGVSPPFYIYEDGISFEEIRSKINLEKPISLVIGKIDITHSSKLRLSIFITRASLLGIIKSLMELRGLKHIMEIEERSQNTCLYNVIHCDMLVSGIESWVLRIDSHYLFEVSYTCFSTPY